MASGIDSTMCILRATLLAATAVALLSGPVAAKVGVTSGADGDPLGKPPNENERVLRIGIDVQANELVTTGARDRAHLVFLDGSALTVGPNARLMIDKFVFDPNTKSGELAINVTKGVFRLVGGKISKNNAVTVTTPSSTIAIRGGIAIFQVTETKTISDFVFGKSMAVTSGGVTQTATRPGSQIVTNLGSPPGVPSLLKPGSLNAALGQLEGTSSNSGGQDPDQGMQRSGLSNTNSSQAPTGTQLPNTPPNPNNNTLTSAINNATTGNQPTNSTTTTTLTSTTPPSPPAPPQPTVIVTVGASQRQPAYQPDTFNAKTLTATPNPANNQTLAPTGSLLNQVATLTIQNGDSLQVPWVPGQIFSFNGNTPYGPATGVGFVDQTGQFFSYSFAPTNGQQRFVLYGGTPTATASFPKQAVGAQQLVNLMTPGNIPFAPDSVGGDAQLKAAANAAPLYSIYGSSPSASKSLQVTVSIAGAGSAQKSYMAVFVADYGVDSSNGNTLYSTGRYGGSYRTDSTADAGRLASTAATANTGQGTAIYGATGQYMVYTPDRIVTSESGTSRVTGASLDQPTPGTSTSYYPVTTVAPATSNQVPSTIGQTRTAQTLTGYAGGLVDTYPNGTTRGGTGVPQALLATPTDVRISTDPSTNQAIGQIILRGYGGDDAALKLTLQLGGAAGSEGPTSAFIDSNTYAMLSAAESSGRQSTLQIGDTTSNVKAYSVLTSANAAPATLPNGGSCACEYLSWGWWSTQATVLNGSAQGSVGQVNMGTYVTGTPTTAVQLPQTGSATYNGMMVGNVNNAGNSYIASGNYQMNWNFAARTGVSNMTFDGTAYTGTASARPGSNGVNFSGSMVGSGRTGAYNGSFFSSPSDGAKYQAGTFSIGTSNTPYKASGIFAGQRASGAP